MADVPPIKFFQSFDKKRSSLIEQDGNTYIVTRISKTGDSNIDRAATLVQATELIPEGNKKLQAALEKYINAPAREGITNDAYLIHRVEKDGMTLIGAYLGEAQINRNNNQEVENVRTEVDTFVDAAGEATRLQKPMGVLLGSVEQFKFKENNWLDFTSSLAVDLNKNRVKKEPAREFGPFGARFPVTPASEGETVSARGSIALTGLREVGD